MLSGLYIFQSSSALLLLDSVRPLATAATKMQSATRRIALGDPHLYTTPQPAAAPPQTLFVVAHFGHTSGDVRLQEYDEQNDTIRVKGYATELGPMRSIAWSPHATYPTLLACGSTAGKISLLDLELASRPTAADSPSSTSGSFATLPMRHARACTSLAWSKTDPNILVAGYDKTRSEPSLLVWDVRRCLATRPGEPPSSGILPRQTTPLSLSRFLGEASIRERRLSRADSRPEVTIKTATPEPTARFCPSESVNSVETSFFSPSTVYVSSATRQVRILDTRSGWPDAVVWSVGSRAVYNLSACPSNEHLFASSEEGLSGIVRIWDARMNAVEVLNVETGRGGVACLSWNAARPMQLGVGTKEGGVLVYEVLSSSQADDDNHDWSILASVKGSEPRSQALQTFSFVPTRDPAKTGVLSVFRDGQPVVEKLGTKPRTSISRQGDVAYSSGSGGAIKNLQARTSHQPHWKYPLAATGHALAVDIGPTMRRKAEVGFGLHLLGNDAIESALPTTSGFLFEWLDRFLNLMSQPEMRRSVDFDFTHQGICGIWNGGPICSKEIRAKYEKGSGALLLEEDFESNPHQLAGWQAVRSNSASKTTRSKELATDSDYVRAIVQIMREKESEFADTMLPVETSRLVHRRLMLAICGELTGDRLDVEIDR